MRRLLLLCLFIITSVANAQNKAVIYEMWYNGAEAPYRFTYVDLPSRPALGTSAILTYSSPGNITNGLGGTTQDKIMRGAWTEFHAFSFTGDAVNHRRISNENSSTVIGSIANHIFSLAGTNPDYFELNGKSPSEPMYFTNANAVTVTSAVQVSAWTGAGPHSWYRNIVSDCGGYGMFMNTTGTLSGGNASTPCTSSANYAETTASYIRSFGPTNGKENFYVGNTSTTAYAIHQAWTGSHLLGYNSTWDGGQWGNVRALDLSHLTIVNSGLAGTDGQNQNFQFQNSVGSCTNSIFYNAPRGGMFCTFEFLFQNNYVHWTGDIAIEVLSYYGNYNTSSRLQVDPTGRQILIEDCDFVATGYTGALLKVDDPNVNITVRNCRIQGPTSLFQDNRGGSPTGSLIDGGGNTFVPDGTIEAPTFENFTPTDFQNHGKLTNEYHHRLGRGYRTPDQSSLMKNVLINDYIYYKAAA